MPLLKQGAFIEDDWKVIADEAPLPVGGRNIVSLARLTGEDGEYFMHCGCNLGVHIAAGEDVEALELWVKRLALIVLEFPKFSDGRAYSSARILRERMGFAGELRASGDVLVDQYAFMLQCGFDSFAIAHGRPLESWRTAQVDLGLRYQTDTTMGPGMSILTARHRTRRGEHEIRQAA